MEASQLLTDYEVLGNGGLGLQHVANDPQRGTPRPLHPGGQHQHAVELRA